VLQGLLNNLLNPKAGLIFVSVFPQFVRPGDSPLRLLLMLAAYEAVLLVWLNLYGFAIARGLAGPRRARLQLWFRRLAGVALVGVGVRLAAERA
jgi:threonine/homoserine/homoserine lactone efflux protein